MYLKRLHLRGFKTFVPPTDLEFDSGVTAIVGPNGSGKSNLVDALRWVLAEQSMRLLRSRRSEDVIFAGSNQRARVGMAEVQLTLDNETGWFGIPGAEVSIARRAHRSGDNEYLLNSTRVRLRDLLELLEKAHAGQSGYTILAQGMADAVLAWRPEERKSLIEEAARLRLPQSQLEEAQQKLAAARQDMLEMETRLAQMAPRLEMVARQAGQAREHAELCAQLEGLQRRHYGNLWAAATSSLETARTTRQEVSSRVEEIEARIKQLQDQMAASRQGQNDAQARLSAMRTRQGEMERNSERWRRQLAVARERQGMLAKQKELMATEAGPLRERAGETQQRLAEAQARLARTSAQRQRAEAELAEAEAGTASLLREEQEKQARLDVLRQEASRLSHRVAELRETKARLEQRRISLASSLSSQSRTLQEMEARAASRHTATARLEARKADLQATSRLCREDLARLEKEASAAQLELDSLRRQRESLSLEVERLRARLQQVTERGDSLLKKLRAATRRSAPANTQPPEFLATLEQVLAAGKLEIQPGMEKAINAALHPYLNDVIVGSLAEAGRALELLLHGAGPEVWLVPSHAQTVIPRLSGGDCLETASSLASFRGQYSETVQGILTRTLVAENLSVACRVAEACPGGFQVVTLDGILVQPGGRVGLASEGPPPIVSYDGQARINTVASRITELDRQIGVAQQHLATSQQQARELQAKIHETDTALQLTEAELANAEAARRRQDNDLRRTRQSLEQQQADAESVVERERQAVEQLEKSSTALALVEQQRSILEEEVHNLVEQRSSTLAELRHRWELLAREEASQRSVAEDTRKRLAEMERELAQREQRASTIEQEDRAASSQIQAAREQIQLISADLKALMAEMEAAETTLRTQADSLDALRSSERELYREQARMESDLREAKSREERARKDLASLEKQIKSDLGSLEGLEPGPAEPDLEVQLRRVTDALRHIGAVDQAAIAQHHILQEEYDRLASQLADVQIATEGLATVVARLEGSLNERFKATLQAVQSEFEQVFRMVFGGGHGRLELITSDDGTKQGLEIIAQPPGKRMQSLASLSGGERALTSIALFFALLHVNPPPFCVLDEVDAALDDANAARFARLLAETSARTQFLVITHNRVTMEAAGTLYGVTMAGTGISQVVSLRLSEAQEGAATYSTSPHSNSRHEVSINV